MTDAVDVWSMVDGLYVTQSEGGERQISIRGLVDVLGAGNYNRLRVLFA